MNALRLEARLSDHDRLYDAFIRMHDGLSEAESQKASAKLVLLLANHIGEPEVILEAIERVRADMGDGSD
ncbi:MAG: DUF2783 domain-containing protein [Alphaproteobacteria bacterium]|nr:MAG: DUF2783 domain-containing protein [Alphaproteobacteria bacterium]